MEELGSRPAPSGQSRDNDVAEAARDATANDAALKPAWEEGRAMTL